MVLNGGIQPDLLLIEDDPDLGALLERALTEEHYGVHVARSGEDGIEFAELRPFDIVVLDALRIRIREIKRFQNFHDVFFRVQERTAPRVG
jgi:DNA-binding NtrC family response regulator